MFFAIVASVMVLCLLLCQWTHSRWPDRRWTVVLGLIALPLSLFILLLLMIWAFPSYQLYPERHSHYVDWHGTDAQKLALKKYREEAARRTFFRRVIEAVRLSPYSGPPCPDIPDGFPDAQGPTGSRPTQEPPRPAN